MSQCAEENVWNLCCLNFDSCWESAGVLSQFDNCVYVVGLLRIVDDTLDQTHFM